MKRKTRELLTRFKPGANRKTHLFLAALLWTSIGTGLMLRGMTWLTGLNAVSLALPALVAGSMKSLFILDKTARKSIDRIRLLADGSCLGAVYSPKTWLLVVAMIFTGYVLRHTELLPLSALGVIYVAIGWALILSSRLAWKAWFTL